MTAIETLANDLLDQQEKELAKRIAFLWKNNEYDAASLIKEIIPVYGKHEGNIDVTLDPDNIYRSFYYIHGWSTSPDFKNITRPYLSIISAHIEGCLKNLQSSQATHRSPSSPFGKLVVELNNSGILPPDLAEHLQKFNKAVNVPAKHPSAYMPTKNLGERTFSVLETAYALVLMRKLSIQLFGILKTRGINLPEQWSPFNDKWLSWSVKI